MSGRIPPDEIREYLSYDKDTGVFTWIKSPATGVHIGQEAGTLNNEGYLRIAFKRNLYSAHRLAWWFVYGKLPKQEIDHINGLKNDNRIINLRDVSRRANNSNFEIHRQGKLVGCYYVPHIKKWAACIKINRKKIHLGCFNTEQEAQARYLEKFKKLDEADK